MVLPSLSLTSTCAFGVVLPLTTVLAEQFSSLIALPSIKTGISFNVSPFFLDCNAINYENC
ncbi:hypothetical protein [Lactobacillus iners]|uniref:hypothetical protein n=1 Tax=Lactobacillus iners TaxID=147802 RepID=UPI0039A672D3